MKKILILISLLFLVGCSGPPIPETAPVVDEDLQAKLAEKDSKITNLEYQVLDLTDMLASLQSDYDELQAAASTMPPAVAPPATNVHMCDVEFGAMNYKNPTSAVAVLEGWFVIQPHVQEMQGSYSTAFWSNTGILTRIHTIRYLSVEDGLSTTESFLIFFNEADWKEGLLSMTDQCWLDFPHQ